MQYEKKHLYATRVTQGLTRTPWSVFIPDSGRGNTPLSRLTNQQGTALRLQILFFSRMSFLGWWQVWGYVFARIADLI